MIKIAPIAIFLGCAFASSQKSFGNVQYMPSLVETRPGNVWPEPQLQITTEQIYQVATEKLSFSYTASSHMCNLLTEAFKRYGLLIRNTVPQTKLQFSLHDPNVFTTVKINLSSTCDDYPYLGMDESYTLDVGNTTVLASKSVWGILRGLETFSQLLWLKDDVKVVINRTTIKDFPRFSHRGILLDTSRHYLPVKIILQNLDAMAYNKFNVFHWHIVDKQSFPYVSEVFPDLSAKGAYTPVTHIYTPTDVHIVIEYARLRGIRVVPEFDTPGHSLSWGKGQPNLLTTCYNGTKPDGTFGPINPILNTTYGFMKTLFTELRSVFRDKYIHLGGDEVKFDCWKSNPNITNFMAEKNITGDYAALEEMYIQQIVNISNELGFSALVWQEVIDNGVKVRNDTLVEVWKKRNPTAEAELSKVTGLGYRTLISSPWYLNVISYGQDWIQRYTFEPYNFNGTDEQKKLVIGGEACMWGEWVDGSNIIPRLWPRASAVAERLWSAQTVNNATKAAPRLHQHRCTLLQRGIPAEPIGPGYCKHEWRK